jgi:hypothetical protein
MELTQGGTVPEALRHIPLPGRDADIPSFLAKGREAAAEAVDLTQVKGIGAVFNGRLQQAGITNFAKLNALAAEKLADILQISLGRAENILADAKNYGSLGTQGVDSIYGVRQRNADTHSGQATDGEIDCPPV